MVELRGFMNVLSLVFVRCLLSVVKSGSDM